MDNITLCTNSECAIKENCKRFTLEKVEGRQHEVFSPVIDERDNTFDCLKLIPMEEQG